MPDCVLFLFCLFAQKVMAGLEVLWSHELDRLNHILGCYKIYNCRIDYCVWCSGSAVTFTPCYNCQKWTTLILKIFFQAPALQQEAAAHETANFHQAWHVCMWILWRSLCDLTCMWFHCTALVAWGAIVYLLYDAFSQPFKKRNRIAQSSDIWSVKKNKISLIAQIISQIKLMGVIPINLVDLEYGS